MTLAVVAPPALRELRDGLGHGIPLGVHDGPWGSGVCGCLGCLGVPECTHSNVPR